MLSEARESRYLGDAWLLHVVQTRDSRLQSHLRWVEVDLRYAAKMVGQIQADAGVEDLGFGVPGLRAASGQ